MDAEQLQDMAQRACGYFEESPGVKSSSRLLAMLIYILIAGVTICACIYGLRPNPDHLVLGAFGLIITALSGCGALIQAKR